jgi:hypothetical protein
MTTTHRLHGKARPRPTRSARIGSWTWADPVVRAWFWVAVIPVLGVVGLAAGSGVSLLWERWVPGGVGALSADRAGGLAATVVLLLPCVQAIRFGNRARTGRDPRGVPPMAVGVLVGGWWLVVAALPFLGAV